MYKIVFELFDRDRSGYIEAQDMAAIAIKLNRTPDEVFGLINGFDTNEDGRVSFGEFVQALWSVQQGEEEYEYHSVSKIIRSGSSQAPGTIVNINVETVSRLNENASAEHQSEISSPKHKMKAQPNFDQQ